MHNLVPKGQKHPSTRPKTSVCTQTSPKGLFLICIIYSSIYVCISYLYLCNYHTTCICPQKAETPKHMAQSLYVCSDEPQRPLSHLICITVSRGDGCCLMISKTTIILIFTYLLTIL